MDFAFRIASRDFNPKPNATNGNARTPRTDPVEGLAI